MNIGNHRQTLWGTSLLILLGVAISCTRNIDVPVSPALTLGTPTNTPTNSPTNTPGSTATNTATNTPTMTNTPNGPTATATNSPTVTLTNTPLNTATKTPTSTQTGTPTKTATNSPTSTPAPNYVLIDDFEGTGGAPSDGSQVYVIKDQNNNWRDGYWFSYDSATNIVINTAAPGRIGGSSVEATGILPTNSAFAGFGFSFTNSANPGCLNNCGVTYYDGTVGGYTGITFWAKMGSMPTSICSNAYAVKVDLVDSTLADRIIVLPFTTTWTQFTVYYNQFAGLTPTALYQLKWEPTDPMTAGQMNYDILIDDVQFVSTVNAAPTPIPAALVDNFEDGDNQSIAANGFTNYWYTYNDATATGVNCPKDGASGGTFFPSAVLDHVSGVGDASSWCLEYMGTGFTTWGAGVGIGTPSNNYDLTQAGTYTGVKFIAKVTAGSATAVRFKIPDNQTDGSDNHGNDLTFTTSWVTYTLPFTGMGQQGWGTATVFSPQTAHDIQWQVGSNTIFDFFVDNITLY